jgi:LacI family transcriptional regulator
MSNMRDVAMKAGVSLPTVSYVINDGPRPVSEETRARVLHAIRELGYRPNRMARGLARKSSLAIALIVPNISDQFFARLSRAIEEVAYLEGFSLFLCNTGGDLKRERSYFSLLAEKRIDGALLVTGGISHEQLRRAAGDNLPVVVLDREIDGAFTDTLIFDNFKAARQATEHLVQHGNTRIACLAGPKSLIGPHQRVGGYMAALKQAGLRFEASLLKWSDYSFSGGMSTARALLQGENRPAAIVACNDDMGVGVIHAARQLGLNVPSELAVAGMGDSFLGQVVIPQLTTVFASVDEMGRRGTVMLLERIRGTAPLAQRRVVLDTKLLVRQSCGCSGDNG